MTIIQSFIKILNHPENQGRPLRTMGRVGWWKLNQLFFHLPAIVTLVDDTQIICEPASSYGSYVVYARYPEPLEMSFFEHYLRATDVVVDVGANIGAWSLIAATKSPQGTIIAFEPTPVANKLRANLRLNNFTNVEVRSEVVSNKDGFEQFSIPKESEISHITTSKKGSRKLKAMTLDTLIAQHHQIKKIDFLKIDVEGAEMKVLQGARKLFAKQKIELVLFEFGKKAANFGYTFADMYTFFDSQKFDLYEFVGNSLQPITSQFASTTTENIVAVLRHSTASKRLKKFI